MSDLNSKYKQIINDIEEKITDKKDQEFVKEKITELSVLYIDIIDRLTMLTNERLNGIEESQREIDNRLNKVQDIVENIESDIYSDDDYEFEVVCPYCNYEFVADIDTESKEELECPECHNIIELDWNEEEGCSHGCSHCSSHCVHEDEEEYNTDEENEDEDM